MLYFPSVKKTGVRLDKTNLGIIHDEEKAGRKKAVYGLETEALSLRATPSSSWIIGRVSHDFAAFDCLVCFFAKEKAHGFGVQPF